MEGYRLGARAPLRPRQARSPEPQRAAPAECGRPLPARLGDGRAAHASARRPCADAAPGASLLDGEAADALCAMLDAAGEEPAAQGQRAQERRSAGEPCAALSASALWHAAAEAAAFVDALGLPGAAAAAVRQRVTALELEIAQQQDQLAGAWRALRCSTAGLLLVRRALRFHCW
jgi:hypothetical protein